MSTKVEKEFYFFIGTTAELLRIAPIIRELKKRKLNYKLILSGQTKVKIDEIVKFTGQLKPNIVFSEKVHQYSSLLFIRWAIKALIQGCLILRNEFKNKDKKNIYFVICGDPVSTSIGAILAKFNGLKIVHIESGDLSGNLLEPFPEEICRHINLRLADILFPPGNWAKNNLKKFNKPKINTIYNSVLESFYFFNKINTNKNIIPREKYYILILHRQEHVIFRKSWSRKTLKQIFDNVGPELKCVIFNHPQTIDIIESIDSDVYKNKNVKVLPIVSYAEFLNIIKHSEFIATDGASNQFEAYLLGTPCLILRDYCEQIEGLNQNVVLYKSNTETLKNFLINYKKFRRKPVKSNVKPSKIILNYLLKN